MCITLKIDWPFPLEPHLDQENHLNVLKCAPVWGQWLSNRIQVWTSEPNVTLTVCHYEIHNQWTRRRKVFCILLWTIDKKIGTGNTYMLVLGVGVLKDGSLGLSVYFHQNKKSQGSGKRKCHTTTMMSTKANERLKWTLIMWHLGKTREKKYEGRS